MKLKKSLSVILAVLMVLSVLSVTAYATPPKYYVAGDSSLCTVSWVADYSDNEMTYDSGAEAYVKEYTNVAPGKYEFLVTDGTFKNSWGDGSGHFAFQVTDTCDVLISFKPNDYTITVIGEDVNVLSAIDFTDIYIVGDKGLCGEAWNPSFANNKMTETKKGVFTITLYDIQPGDYLYEFVADGEYAHIWGSLAESYALSGDLDYNCLSNNLGIEVEEECDITFTFSTVNMDGKTGEGATYSVDISVKQNGTTEPAPDTEPETTEPAPDTEPETTEPAPQTEPYESTVPPTEPPSETTEPAPDTEPYETTAPTTEPPYETTEPTTEPYESTAPTTEAPETEATIPANPKLWVGGVEVNDQNAQNITGEGIQGKVSFDKSTSTLTLRNVKILGAYTDTPANASVNPYMAGIYSEMPISIKLVGTNEIDIEDAVPDDNKDYNVFGLLGKGTVYIMGTGKLTTDGMIGSELRIDKTSEVISSVSVGMMSRMRNAVSFDSITLEGKLSASCTSLYYDFPAIDARIIDVAKGAVCTAYASNSIYISNSSPYAAKAIRIDEGGMMKINGTVTATGEGTTTGSETSAQVNNGYGIYGKNNATVVLGDTGNLTASGKKSAIAQITFSLNTDNFEIKAGSSQSDAQKVQLSDIDTQNYVSFKSTYVPPATRATYSTRPATVPETASETVPETVPETVQPTSEAKETTSSKPVPTVSPSSQSETTEPEAATTVTVPASTEASTNEPAPTVETGAPKPEPTTEAVEATVSTDPAKGSPSNKPAGNNKKSNPVKVSAKLKTIKLSKLKSKKQTVKPLTVKNAQGAVKITKVKTNSIKKINKKITVNSKTGAITFKKGTYAAKLYKIKLKINVKGNNDYKPRTLTKTVKVRIKKK